MPFRTRSSYAVRWPALDRGCRVVARVIVQVIELWMTYAVLPRFQGLINFEASYKQTEYRP
jgi:hypothetical protein